MVIDSHAHIFPFLGGRSGYSSVEEHLTVCQRAMHEHLAQPARRVKDHSPVEKKLWDPTDPTLKGKRNVGFRVGEFGRFEWNQNGEECYIQYLPPYFEHMACSPYLLVAMMDYAGIDQAVLQCGAVYGKLNYYYALVMDEFPSLKSRFLPLAQIDERHAYEEVELKKLEHAIKHMNLKGLWFAADNNSFGPDYQCFWEAVEDMNIPVFLQFYPEKKAWLSSLKSTETWIERHSKIVCVLPQAFPLSTTEYNDEIEIPDFAKRLINTNNLYIEICYPISRGRVEDYPFPISRKAIKKLYDIFGPTKLVWGSDVPMVERYCTYAQSLKYLTDYCDFISKKDIELIVGGNLVEIFRL
ncbi:MAG: amidohydrolase family protein [Candidatus Hadarchaeum sp.]|uniref:amidohydrolase family protein n=1 Tax=Candidatus Hadarchaeum sp. TaxID=2883567 RepID=UPI003174ECB4